MNMNFLKIKMIFRTIDKMFHECLLVDYFPNGEKLQVRLIHTH